MITKIKNRTDKPQQLFSATGDSVQINPHAIAMVDESFLIDFDRLKIQILDKKVAPKPQQVEVVVAQVAPILEESKPTFSKGNSKAKVEN
jgi:hypothetical protein